MATQSNSPRMGDPDLFFVYFLSLQQIYRIKPADSARFELGSLEHKASTLTIWPPPRPLPNPTFSHALWSPLRFINFLLLKFLYFIERRCLMFLSHFFWRVNLNWNIFVSSDLTDSGNSWLVTGAERSIQTITNSATTSMASANAKLAMKMKADLWELKWESLEWNMFDKIIFYYICGCYQCDQMAMLVLNLWPFTTMKICPVA